MINSSRIVPVEAVDLLTLYGNIMKLAGTTVAKIDASDIGVFAMTSGSGNVIASEPVKSFDFGESVSAAVVYFVPAYDFEGFSIQGGSKVKGTIDADGATLCTATLSSGTITIAKVGF